MDESIGTGLLLTRRQISVDFSERPSLLDPRAAYREYSYNPGLLDLPPKSVTAAIFTYCNIL
jgi:hypothetical protein